MLVMAPLIDPARDPAPVERIEGQGMSPVVLVCEHAGQAVPQRLGDLGLSTAEIDLHIGWDIGAAAVTRLMAEELGCAAILQRYSRLVIDCNRPPTAPDSIPEVSDGVAIPGNASLSPADRVARVEAVFAPFDAAIALALEAPPKLVVAVHSFTPCLASVPVDRPWHIGFLFRGDSQTPARLAESLTNRKPDLIIGMNEPYQIDDASDWFVPHHGEGSGLPHALIEIRQDLIRDPAGQEAMAHLLSAAIRDLLETSC